VAFYETANDQRGKTISARLQASNTGSGPFSFHLRAIALTYSLTFGSFGVESSQQITITRKEQRMVSDKHIASISAFVGFVVYIVVLSATLNYVINMVERGQVPLAFAVGFAEMVVFMLTWGLSYMALSLLNLWLVQYKVKRLRLEHPFTYRGAVSKIGMRIRCTRDSHIVSEGLRATVVGVQPTSSAREGFDLIVQWEEPNILEHLDSGHPERKMAVGREMYDFMIEELDAEA
jgi:hypothetical protein